MKTHFKIFTAVIALVASLAIGSFAIAAPGDDDKVESTASLKYNSGSNDPYDDDYNQASFSGKVKAKQDCAQGRSVKIKGVGKAKTNSKGKYTISAGSGAAPGKYQAKVKKKTLKQKGGKDTVCGKTTSNKVTVS